MEASTNTIKTDGKTEGKTEAKTESKTAGGQTLGNTAGAAWGSSWLGGRHPVPCRRPWVGGRQARPTPYGLNQNRPQINHMRSI